MSPYRYTMHEPKDKSPTDRNGGQSRRHKEQDTQREKINNANLNVGEVKKRHRKTSTVLTVGKKQRETHPPEHRRE